MPRGDRAGRGSARGNYISEWFGHRVYPDVARGQNTLDDQQAERCPFLTAATGTPTRCVKPPPSIGVCTVSSCSNGFRQDWLVCPYRVVGPAILGEAARMLFALRPDEEALILPAPRLAQQAVRDGPRTHVASGGAGIVYLQDKLGGEISLRPTDRSPEFDLDITMAEIAGVEGTLGIRRYGIVEVQTMDFHGSYRKAVQNLRDALRLHRADFARVLQENQPWLSEGVQSPNISNVFKRTFYQMVFKFQLGEAASCGGCVLAVPSSVWGSWQRHLGKPDLEPLKSGLYGLFEPSEPAPTHLSNWILVFDMVSDSDVSPNPIRIEKVIATTAEAISYYALTVAPEAAVAEGGASGGLLAAVHRRLLQWWPEVAMIACPRPEAVSAGDHGPCDGEA